jgi:hypothetical protein
MSTTPQSTASPPMTGKQAIAKVLADRAQAFLAQGKSQADIDRYLQAVNLSVAGQHDAALKYVVQPEVTASWKALGLRADGPPTKEAAPVASAPTEIPRSFSASPCTEFQLSNGTLSTALGYFDEGVFDVALDAVKLLWPVGASDFKLAIQNGCMISIGAGVSGGDIEGLTGGVGIIFYSNGSIGFYGTIGGLVGGIESISGTVQIAYVRGTSYSGWFYGVNAAGGDGVVAGVTILYTEANGSWTYAGWSASLGVGEGASLEAYASATYSWTAQNQPC